MKVPFCIPLIDDDVVDEVHDCLTNTGWLTSGPKVLLLEKEIEELTGIRHAVCVNSWTSGAMLVLRWFGVGPGDEVIIPAYTYSATALCALNIGAKVVMVDVGDDFNINADNISSAITSRTKAIIPVDIGGWPCDYDQIMEVVDRPDIKSKFTPTTERQEKLGRILVVSDSAHSIGATYKNEAAAMYGDFSIFSLHSVKNITAGEGGAICINLPQPFDLQEQYGFLKAFSLNGQTKSAFEKNQIGSWRYDIIDQGLKVNMPDICASVALAQIRKYKTSLLPDRKTLFERYNKGFESQSWAILPPYKSQLKESSCHLYMIRIKGIREDHRDEMIDFISKKEVGVNVHYIPMATLTLFKNMGYSIDDYPITFQLYENEITLPIYNGLSVEQVDYVVETVIEAFDSLNLS